MAAMLGAAVPFAGCVLVEPLDGLTGGAADSGQDARDGRDGDGALDSPADTDAGDSAAPEASGPEATSPDAGDSSAADVGTTETGTTVPAFVQSGASSNNGTTGTVTFAATRAGDLVVVTIAQESGSTAVVTGITDDAPAGTSTYVSAGERAVDTSCGNTTEIWYARNAQPGATSVKIAMSASVTFEAWAAEFSGLSTTSPLDTGAVASSQPSTTTIDAPTVTPSVPNALVVSVAASCGAISGLAAASPFRALPIKGGEDTAYYVAPTIAAYGPVFTSSSGTWNASTVDFE